jgi:hypothetical protein
MWGLFSPIGFIVILVNGNTEHERAKMSTLIKYKTWDCSECGIDYQGVFAYLNYKGEVVCNDCLSLDIPVGA